MRVYMGTHLFNFSVNLKLFKKKKTLCVYSNHVFNKYQELCKTLSLPYSLLIHFYRVHKMDTFYRLYKKWINSPKKMGANRLLG